jgi:hypothetical protein
MLSCAYSTSTTKECMHSVAKPKLRGASNLQGDSTAQHRHSTSTCQKIDRHIGTGSTGIGGAFAELLGVREWPFCWSRHLSRLLWSRWQEAMPTWARGGCSSRRSRVASNRCPTPPLPIQVRAPETPPTPPPNHTHHHPTLPAPAKHTCPHTAPGRGGASYTRP